MTDSQLTRALSDLSRSISSPSSDPEVLYIEEMEAREKLTRYCPLLNSIRTLELFPNRSPGTTYSWIDEDSANNAHSTYAIWIRAGSTTTSPGPYGTRGSCQMNSHSREHILGNPVPKDPRYCLFCTNCEWLQRITPALTDSLSGPMRLWKPC